MTAFSLPAVEAALAALAQWGGAEGPDPEKAMRYALLAGVAEQERHEAREREHARRRDDPLRLADLACSLERAQAHRRRTAAEDVL